MGLDQANQISLHNHPSTQTFSLEDIQFFIGYASVGLMVLVGNQGVVHYLSKNNKGIEIKRFVLIDRFVLDVIVLCKAPR